ncbi:hypothetical protein M4D76_27195 [Peribacillus frigoritolerans]|uniref:AbiTii domain-containing protein n=1 Tax=Peribacillus frigoritolerans TaxID=450367 RepID=UPI0021A64AB5|nr:hypothetical protein [Peribacillus frigoritolerans]MCT1391936.1 hypothetical protein [Peribacillus frigoritolerans]
MARSQLLKDVVTGKESIESILLRLKVILSDLDNEPIINWVNGELRGYKEEDDVPRYRILKGTPMGTYIVNQGYQYSNAPVPLMHLLSEDFFENIITLSVRDSIATIQNVLNGENRENYSNIIPTEMCHGMSTDELQIVSMRISFSSNKLDRIVSNVKSRLVDIVMELEKQFDNLDDLDIKDQVEESSSKKEQVIYNIEQIIYEGSIKVGDKNKISKSILGHMFGGKE